MYSDSMKELRLSTGRRVVVDYDESSLIGNPRDACPVSYIIGLSGLRFNVFDKEFGSIEALYEEKAKAIKNGAFVFDLYAHIHSSITLSLSPFLDTYDSSFIGFCIVYKNDGIYSKERAWALAENELYLYSKWLNGEVYEVLVEHPEGFDCVIDDCAGGLMINSEEELIDSLELLDLTDGERREVLDNLDKLMPY